MNARRRFGRATSRTANDASIADLAAMAPAILSAVSPLMAALPKLVPFVTRAVRRHPTQAIVGLVGLGLLALQLRRSRNRNSHEPPLLR